MTTTNAQEFYISDSAAKRINHLISEEEDNAVKLRISVLGGGCSGFQYKFDFDNTQNDDDIYYEHNGAPVLVDKTSIEFLENSTLDYVETLGSAAFTIKNPNATANCGCGNSFSV